MSVDFFIYINMGTCFCLLFLIKIFNMAAEPYRGVLVLSSLSNEKVWTLTDVIDVNTCNRLK